MLPPPPLPLLLLFLLFVAKRRPLPMLRSLSVLLLKAPNLARPTISSLRRLKNPSLP
jgi:hypothetical protein